MKMLKIENVNVNLGKFSLREVNFRVEKGEYFVLLGMSGAGKSVLLQVIGGLIRSGSGSITLDGREISREKVQRRGVGLVFQDSALFPHMSVYNNIAYPLRSKGYRKAEIRGRVNRLAELTNVTHLLGRSPANLSGGEKQRVALARAMALKPPCLLLDEPLSSLDVQLRRELRLLLRNINSKGQTIVHVTHDYEEAALLADRIGVIENGTVVQAGTPGEVFLHPSSEFVANFAGIRNFFRGELLESDSSLKQFRVTGKNISVLTAEPAGKGYITLRAEDITLSNSKPESSAANCFYGNVVSVEPAGLGVEVTVDAGIKLCAMVSRESAQKMEVIRGSNIWASFKATAVKYIPG